MADDAKAKRQKAFYTKQREDAEKGAAKGDDRSADTAAKIYRKLGQDKAKKGGYSAAQGDIRKSQDYEDQVAGKGKGPRDPARNRKIGRGIEDAVNKGGDMAGGFLRDMEGGRLLGGAASKLASGAGRMAKNSASALGNWAKGAGRSGAADASTAKKAADSVSKAASKSSGPSRTTATVNGQTAKASTNGTLKPRPPEAAPGGAKTATTGKRTFTGNVPKAAEQSVKETGQHGQTNYKHTDNTSRYNRDGTTKTPDNSTSSPASKVSVKKSGTSAPAAPKSGGSATDAYRNAKGKDARSAAWKAMSKDERTAYQSARDAKGAAKKPDDKPPEGGAPAAKKGGKGPKTPKAPAAEASKPAQKSALEMTDDELHAYMNDPKSPRNERGVVIAPSASETAKAPAEAAAASGGKPKGGFVRQKMRDAKAAKEAAANGSAPKTPVNTEAAAKVKANIAAKKDAKADFAPVDQF